MDIEHPNSIMDDESLIGDEILLSNNDEEVMIDIETIMIYSHLTPEREADRVFRTELLWIRHLELPQMENQFERTFFMTPGAFNQLVENFGKILK